MTARLKNQLLLITLMLMACALTFVLWAFIGNSAFNILLALAAILLWLGNRRHRRKHPSHDCPCGCSQSRTRHRPRRRLR